MSRGYMARGMLYLVCAQITVGFNIVLSKQLLATIPFLMLLSMRFTIATLLLIPLHWLTPASKIPLAEHFSKVTRKDWVFLIIQALCAGAFFNCLMLLGLHYTDANVAGIITSALPAIVACVSWIVLREKITPKKSLCILLATAGLVVIACDKFKGVGASHSFLGDIIVLLALIPEATYYVLSKIHHNRLPLFLTSAVLNGMNAVILSTAMLFFHCDIPVITFHSGVLLFFLGLAASLFFIF